MGPVCMWIFPKTQCQHCHGSCLKFLHMEFKVLFFLILGVLAYFVADLVAFSMLSLMSNISACSQLFCRAKALINSFYSSAQQQTAEKHRYFCL